MSELRFGDPWHGLIKNGVIELPNATTRALAGAVPIGGDCLKVQRPGQAALDQTPTELAAGMEWRNYGLISGYNRVIFGTALNSLSWLYIAPDNTVWQVDYSNGAGSLAFTRFGDFDHPAAGAVQTTGVGTTNTEYNTRCLDVTATGDKAIISSEIGTIYQQASRGVPNILRGVFLISITGTPPNASATWTVLADEATCQGARTNTRYHTYLGYGCFSTGGEKSLSGAVIGAVFLGGAAASLVTVDVLLTDSGDDTFGPSPEAIALKTKTRQRTGYLRIKAGAETIHDLPFGWHYFGQFDENNNWQIITLNLEMGGKYSETDPIYAYRFVSSLDFPGIDFEVDSTHIVMHGPAPVTWPYQGDRASRFIPSRYSNNAYGVINAQGAKWYLQDVDDPWREENCTLTEFHYVKSVLGGTEKTLSWTGLAGPLAGVGNELAQRVFATVQPVTNQLEMHSASVVFR